MRGFINGIVFTVALLLAAAVASVMLGILPPGADVKPGSLERWAARKSLDATIARETKGITNPLQPSDANVIAGVHVYAANCAVCHGAADGAESNVAKGLYIRAPQLAKHGVEDDDESETFWKVEHGIRFTGMPAFGSTLSSDDAWKVTMFLKRMDALPAAVASEWQKVPSVAATGAPK